MSPAEYRHEKEASSLSMPCTSKAAGVSDTLIARLPVLDRLKRVNGYKITHNSSDFSGDDSVAGVIGRRAILGLLHMVGLEEIASRHCIHFPADAESVISGDYTVLPADRTTLILPVKDLMSGSVIEACHKANRQGYEISILVDYPEESLIGLEGVSRSIRMNVSHASTACGQHAIAEMLSIGYRLTAIHVDSYDDFKLARDLGFDFFQGSFYCKPESITCRALSASQTVCLRLLNELNTEPLAWDNIEDLIESDVTLSYGLLRYLNSAALGIRNKVTSIHQAMALLGEVQLRRWASIATIETVSQGKPAQLLIDCLVRASFCEQLAGPFGVPDQGNELYLAGLLSLIDAMLDRPMGQIVKSMPLEKSVVGALLGEDNSIISKVLRLAIACEKGNWTTAGDLCSYAGISTKDVVMQYYSAIYAIDSTLPA